MMNHITLKDCYVKLEPLESLLSTNDAASLAYFTKESDSTIQTLRKFLISKVNFRRETQQLFNASVHGAPGAASVSPNNSAPKASQKLHICHICFQSFALNCDLRDHVFFAHTAHPTLQETLKVNIVGTDPGLDIDYDELLSGTHGGRNRDEGATSIVTSHVVTSRGADVSPPTITLARSSMGPVYVRSSVDLIRKSGRRPVKNRKYEDYLAPPNTAPSFAPKNGSSSSNFVKEEFVVNAVEGNSLDMTPMATMTTDMGTKAFKPVETMFIPPPPTILIPKLEPYDQPSQNSCNICGKLFAKRLLLKRHFDSVHLRLRPHLCYECGEKFASKDTLAQHIRTIHEKSRPFICTLCPGPNGKAFTRKQCLTTHIRVAHRDLILRQNNPNIEVVIIDPFNPDNPSPIIANPSTNLDEDADEPLQQLAGVSQMAQTERKPSSGAKIKLRYYRCHFCGKIFNQEAHLSRHIKSVHERLKPYKCYLCAKIPIGPNILSDAEVKDSQLILNGMDPGYMVKSFSRKEFLIKHIRSVHQGYRGYQCEDCGMKYCDKRDMENHRKKAHSAFQNPGATRRCPYDGCGKVFTSRIHLSKHLKKFHPHSKPVSSGVAQQNRDQQQLDAMVAANSQVGEGSSDGFANFVQGRDNGTISFLDGMMVTAPSMMGEERTLHVGDSLANYGGMMSDMDHILTDINFDTMSGGREVGKGLPDPSGPPAPIHFPDPMIFDGVTESDSPDAVFMCESCDKGFINRASLIRHFKSVHENHRAYTCHICGRSFNQKPHLERHLSSLIHADILKYPCDYCGKRFALKSQLEKHLFDLNYHRDPNYVRVPKYVCYICTPPEALAIGNELDFVADGEDPYAAIASGGTKTTVLNPNNAPISASMHSPSSAHIMRSNLECHSSDEESDANDGILRVNSTFRHRNVDQPLDRPTPGRPRSDADDRLLATLTSTLDEGRVSYEPGFSGPGVAGISAVPAEPGSIRDQLHHIRQTSIVRFGRKKDLIKHLKEVHYGHIAFNQLGLASTPGDSQQSPLLNTQHQQQIQDQPSSPQLDTSSLTSGTAYDAGQLAAILMRDSQMQDRNLTRATISSEEELAQYCNELENAANAAAASERMDTTASTNNFLLTDALTTDQNKIVAAVMGGLTANGNVYDVVNNFVLINGPDGMTARCEGTELMEVCDAEAQQQLRCAIEEHARRNAQESGLDPSSYEEQQRCTSYRMDDAMNVTLENEQGNADDGTKGHPSGMGGLIIRNAISIPLTAPLQISTGYGHSLVSNCGGNTNSLIMSNLAALNNSLGAASQRAHLNTLQQQYSLSSSSSLNSPHALPDANNNTDSPLLMAYNTGLDPILAAAPSPSASLPIYECKVCCRTFASKVNLRRHNERIHTDLKPSHLCEFCGKVFGYARTLRDHIHSAHRDECRDTSFDLIYDMPPCGDVGVSDEADDGGGGGQQIQQHTAPLSSNHPHHHLIIGNPLDVEDDDDDDLSNSTYRVTPTIASVNHVFASVHDPMDPNREQQLRIIYAAAYGPEGDNGTMLSGTSNRAAPLTMMEGRHGQQDLDY